MTRPANKAARAERAQRKADRAAAREPQVVMLPGGQGQGVQLGEPTTYAVAGKLARGYMREACALRGTAVAQARKLRQSAEQIEREAEARWLGTMSEILEEQHAMPLGPEDPAVVSVDLERWEILVRRPAKAPVAAAEAQPAAEKPAVPAEAPAAEKASA